MSRSPGRPPAPRSTAWWPVLLLLAWTTLVYLPSLSNGFVYDDDSVIKEAAALFTHPSVGGFFSTRYFVESHESTYRPLVTLTYLVDWRVGGGTPGVFHLQNLLWHLASVAALALLVRRLGASPFVQYASAAIYAVHPAIAEAVNGIAFREDLLVTAFGLVGLLVATGDWPGRTALRAVLSGACFLLALFSKETAVVFVVLLPLTSWAMSRTAARGRRTVRGSRVEWAVLAASTLAYLVVRFGVFPAAPNYGSRIADSVWSSLGTGLVAIGYYVRLLVVPYPLCADYRGVMAFVTTPGDWRLWAAGAALASITAGVWRLRASNPLAVWGWVWFVVCIAPVSNLIPIPMFMAERFLHLPYAGAVVLVVSTVAMFLRSRGGQVAVTAMVVIGLSSLTWSRQAVWASNETLWRATLADYPTATGALHGLGTALVETKRYGEAIPYLERALSVETSDRDRRAAVLLDLGVAYASTGRGDDAVAAFRGSLAASPTSRAHNNLAIVLYNANALDEADEHWRAALELEPGMADALAGLAAVKTRRGQ